MPLGIQIDKELLATAMSKLYINFQETLFLFMIWLKIPQYLHASTATALAQN